MGPCGALGVGPNDCHSNTHAVDLAVCLGPASNLHELATNENNSTFHMVKKCIKAIIINITCNLEEAGCL